MEDARVVAKTLLERGAEVDAADSMGRTPLHWACAHGHVEMVKMLQVVVTDKNVKDNVRPYVWHMAAPLCVRSTP
eukprot:907755-Prorocentrum_minimum.AAC.1